MDGTQSAGHIRHILQDIDWQNPYLDEESADQVKSTKRVHTSHPSSANYFYAETQEITAVLGIEFNPDNPIPARNTLVKALGSHDVMFSEIHQEDDNSTPIMYVSVQALHDIGVKPVGSEEYLPKAPAESTYEL